MNTRSEARPRAPFRRLAGAVLAALLAVSATACTGDDEEPADAGGSPSQALPSEEPVEFEVATTTDVGKVTGKLTREARQRVVRQVGPVVERYVDAAYGGSYPRGDFGDFPGFTRVARERAQQDAVLLTNQALGERITGVVPKRSRVVLDVLGVKGHAAAVTARVSLVFVTEGDARKRVTVRGRLLLTPGERGWQVFGYHLAKEVR